MLESQYSVCYLQKIYLNANTAFKVFVSELQTGGIFFLEEKF